MRIVECVPNFSEGRRAEIIEQVLDAMRGAPGAQVLDVKSDPDHNRTVVTLVGTPEAVEEAAFRGTAAAARLIDMREHKGAHPRVGAMDVIPFVPVRGVSMKECVRMAQHLGERIGRELNIPVYLYEEAATRPDRQNLADVRKGEYEGLREDIATDPNRAPDYGPAEMGPAGAIAVGARPFLIAFNVNLGTKDLGVAKAIAKAVRHSSGGYRYVKALGVPAGDVVQVSMNMTNYAQSPLHRVLETIRSEAARHGVAVIGSEIVGITPAKALTDAAVWYLGLHGMSDGQILENRLREEAEDALVPLALLGAVAAPTATPGGGSVSALAGALGAALVQMYAGLTLGKASYAGVQDEAEAIRRRAEELRVALAELVREDSEAYQAVMKAYAMPKAMEYEQEARREAIEQALVHAAEVPMQVARLSLEAIELAGQIVEKGSASCLCDGGVAVYMAQAALNGALLNVETNVKTLRDREKAAALSEEAAQLRDKADALAAEILAQVKERL